MQYEWDENKRTANRAKHGVDFGIVYRFSWKTALVFEDTRLDYRERRFRSLGFIDGRLYVLAFTQRDKRVRVISLRKANNREARGYETAIQKHR